MAEDSNEWRAYKLEKAMAMVMYEYSIEWTPVDTNWMTVYTPGCSFDQRNELRATTKFFMETSKYGIDGGCISKLCIQETDYHRLNPLLFNRPQRRTVYSYDRGADVDHLDEHPEAKRLFDVILEELN